MTKEEVYQKAILIYGKEHQQIVAIEEFSEAQKEVTKALRGQLNIDHLIEELADARIMIEQLMMIHEISELEIEREMNYKVSRLYERLKV